MSYDGKVVLITGAGSGIGRASVLAFAREGATVVAADLDGVAAQATAEQAVSGRAIAMQGDVARPADIRRIIDDVIGQFGRLDVFFQNAGVPQAARPVEDISLDEWQRIIAVNLTALFLGAQVAAPIMKEQRSGVILVTASIAGIRPRPGLSAYVASKGGAIALVKALALELAPFQVRVNALCPVAVNTPMVTRFGFGGDLAEAGERFAATIPLGRLTTPEEIAAGALYLASDAASAVTGITLEIDGGRGV